MSSIMGHSRAPRDRLSFAAETRDLLVTSLAAAGRTAKYAPRCAAVLRYHRTGRDVRASHPKEGRRREHYGRNDGNDEAGVRPGGSDAVGRDPGRAEPGDS